LNYCQNAAATAEIESVRNGARAIKKNCYNDGWKDFFFMASVPSLPGCHTQAKSLDARMESAKEAIELYIEVEGLPVSTLGFVGIQPVTMANRQRK
jgi:predicted RNase H-like HicB family nuclease